MSAYDFVGTKMSGRGIKAALVSLMACMLVVAATATAAMPVAGAEGVTFNCRAPEANAVYLAGSFNGWNATAQPMTRHSDGSWVVTVALAAGEHEYKFVVDGAWQEDPDNPRRKADPFGGNNSLVVINADGSLAGEDPAALKVPAAVAAPAAPAATTAAAMAPAKFTVGAPRPVDGGIQFTYHNPGASRVTLAGSFNGWNAEDLPMKSDGDGNWVIVHPLPAGKHEYKFVADGSWFADPENPETQSDPYGGTNSLANVGPDGKLIASGSASDTSRPRSNTALNAKVYVGGRYLTRFEFAKNLRSDRRFRLQRPSQSVDLNFETKVSDITETYTRLRLDSDQSITQNNVVAFLDEASLSIRPSNFAMKAFWNQETFTGGDVMQLGGNIDLPGTIGHDHIDAGKGTAGGLFTADPVGVHVAAFFANAHDQDYYNDPVLFDNTGEDRIGVRLSRKVGKLEIGVPLWAERWLMWLDFGELVSLPSTGIPALDQHRLDTNDSSAWYEVENHIYNLGLDMRYRPSDQWTLGVQGTAVDRMQRFVTGNEYGQNNTNGAMDEPFLDRTQGRFMIEADWAPRDGLKGSLKHLWTATNGGTGVERELLMRFDPQATANKQIKFLLTPSPAVATNDSTDLSLDWNQGSRTISVWIRRASLELDYGAVGRNVPADTLLVSHRQDRIYLAGRLAAGLASDPRGHAELEWCLTRADFGAAGRRDRIVELILRYDRDLTRTTGLIGDFRLIDYHSEANGADAQDHTYFAPFAGLRYTPIRKLDLVAAYGVDPVDYSIAYGGRQLGRWGYRQNWLFENPGATANDAENQLAKARVFTLRAQLQF